LVAIVIVGWTLAAVKGFRRVWLATRLGRIRPIRAIVGCVSLVAFGTAILLTRTPHVRVARGIVDFVDTEVVRADSSGFIEQILVVDGEEVVAGQPLIELRNETLQLEVEELTLNIDASHVRSRLMASNKDHAGAQAELAHEAALQKRLAEKETQLASLQLVAPISGRIMARDLKSRGGQFVEPGQELLRIGNHDKRELQVLVEQNDLRAYAAREGDKLTGRIRGVGTFEGILSRIEPRAHLLVHHAALSARNGGPLDVRSVSYESRNSVDPNLADELVRPGFLATVELTDSELQSRLQSGQIGLVRVSDRSQTLASNLYQSLNDWYDRQVQYLTDRGRAEH